MHFKSTSFLILVSGAIVLLLTGCQPKELTSAKTDIQNRNWRDALQQLEAAVQKYPNNSEVHFLLGEAYARIQRFRNMNREFESSLKLSNKFQQAIINDRDKYWIDKYKLATTSLHTHDFANADKALNLAFAIDSTRTEAYKAFAAKYLNLEQPGKALELYEHLLQSNPQDIDLLTAIAKLHTTQRHYAEAIRLQKEIIRLEPDNVEVLASLALGYSALGKTAQANATFEEAIRVNPNNLKVVALYAENCLQKQRFTKAIDLFQQVLQQENDNSKALSSTGIAYLGKAEENRRSIQHMRGRKFSLEEIRRIKSEAISYYQKAIPFIEEALNQDPNQPELLRNLGIAYINTGSREKGETFFQKAERLIIQQVEERL